MWFNMRDVNIYSIGGVCGLPGRGVLCVVSELWWIYVNHV